MTGDREDVNPTYPAQAQWRVLRYAARLLEQTIKDLGEPEMREALLDLLGCDAPEPEQDTLLVRRALYGLARELLLRADQTWDANVEFLRAQGAESEASARRN